MLERYNWQDRAACKDQTELFFSGYWRDWQTAKNICAGCPVRRECLTDALKNEDRFGVWGGNDQYELRTALSIDKKGDPVRATKPPRCPYCKSRDVATLEKKRTRVHYECEKCTFEWWSRRVPMRREPKSGNVDGAVPAGS